MKTARSCLRWTLGIISLDARFLVDAGHPAQPSRSSKPNQENHTYDDVFR
jgi:hypothetical protein